VPDDSELQSLLDLAQAEIRRLREENGALRELEEEMQLASRIQTSILPPKLSIDGLELATAMVPAATVCGDYYDAQLTGDGCWIGIGDVCGHGVTAGLVMMMMQSAIAAAGRARPDGSPRDILAVVNDVIYENIHRRLGIREFVTLSLLRYRSSERTITFAGAHEDILVVRTDGRIDVIETRGIWLGQKKDIWNVTVEGRFELDDGDLVALFTDGITEARNAANAHFGVERVARIVADNRLEPPDAICARVLEAASAWTAVQDDDRTIVVARRRT
jgi:serine phosphatase RsbU (regulator of sigma subunit)